MEITIHTKSAIPLYEQIILQIIEGVKNGALHPKEGLPSIRQLASDLSLTANTVAKSYQMLERNNIILTGGRRGTYIHPEARENAEIFIYRHTRKRVQDLIDNSSRYGLNPQALKNIFLEILSTK